MFYPTSITDEERQVMEEGASAARKDLLSQIAALKAENERLTKECEKLSTYFRDEAPTEGFEGDVEGLSPIETAIRVLRNRALAERAGGVKATHRHKKRGTEYVLIGFGKLQAEMWVDWNSEPVDMREVAVYRSVDDGSLWVRPREEFEDGRFEVLAQKEAGR